MIKIDEQIKDGKSTATRKGAEVDFRSIFNLAAVGISVTDLEGRFLEVNQDWLDFSGYSREELLARTYSDITYPDDRQAICNIFAALLAGQNSSVRFETRYRNKDGSTRWAEVSMSKIPDGEGKPVAMIGVAVDISQRKEIEYELNDTRNQLQSILEGIKDGVLVLAADYSMHFINRAAAELLGFSSPEEATEAFKRQDRDYQFTLSDDQGTDFSWNNFPGFLALKGVEEPPRTICLLNKISGEKRWLIIGATPIYNCEGKVQFSVSITHEITERVKAQEMLEKNEELFRKLVVTSPDAISVTDLEGKVTFISQKALEIFGATRMEEEIGQPVFAWIHPRDHQKAFSVFAKILAGVIPNEDNSYHLLRKDGSMFFAEINSAPLTDSRSRVTGMISTIRDVTGRKKVEADLLQKTAELARSNRDLEQFAYVASHDLQEPLRKIRSFIDLLQTRADEQGDQKTLEYMTFVQDAARRMQALTSDILQYSRAGAGEIYPRQVDLNQVVTNVLSDLDLSIQSLGAIVKVDPLPTLVGNEGMLSHLFQNLISNALKYRSSLSPEICISASKQVGEDENAAEAWLFCVKDNGIGIPPASSGDIFQAFKRLHSQADYPGSGIGLAICKKIVERHGGKIWVESQVGQGSVFFFSLPASCEPALDTISPLNRVW